MRPSAPNSAITLQINLCAGDLAYARATVRALVATHRADVAEVLVVADGCRPPSTPWMHAGSRFPRRMFAQQVVALRELCAEFTTAGIVDRVVWLELDGPALRMLNTRHAGVATGRSHDHLGHAFSAYFLGWDASSTRYVAHFDADIVLWQQRGFSWLRAAQAALESDATLLAASPRIAPPPSDGRLVRVDAPGSGWLASWPLERVPGGWHSPWFSTRCHMIDRERLRPVLPLSPARGRAADRRAARIDRCLGPLYTTGWFAALPEKLRRALAGRIPPFPLPPEVLLHESAKRHGFRCLYFADPRAWYVHPDTKTERFLRVLPRLLANVNGHGECPAEQRGVSDVQLAAWEEFRP